MILNLVPSSYITLCSCTGLLLAFAVTMAATAKLCKFLPKDAGREYAADGKLSAGKPRGAGLIFVLVFVACAVLFAPVSAENLIYLVLMIVCMMTGYLDDASKSPWGEYRKGFLDLCVAVLVAVTFLYFNPSEVELAFFHVTFTLPPVVFGLLVVVLVWVSVNVTNCCDGVDGLSGTMTVITVMTIYAIDMIKDVGGGFTYQILLFVMCILGYLWYNANPSRLLMGDAGSRTMGLFISIAVLKTGCPFLYIPVAFVILMDGGLGLVKVFLMRFLKIRFLSNVRMPIHDHVRKVWRWSNTQTVFRYAIVQIIIAVAVLYGIQM